MSTRLNNQLIGTENHDLIEGTDSRDDIKAGEGADSISGGLAGDIINPGDDNSRDVIWYSDFDQKRDIIEDFDPNDEDIVVLTSGFFWDLVHNEGLNSDANLGDWLQIHQFGSDTYIQVDSDGLQGNTPFRTLAILKDVNANDLTIDIQEDGDFFIG
ncbi:MAG: type I secretion C-terminal target domain-containing protein [Moorea sp. SIO3G5]|nr:type I secretion C-terminal target domain-containing protein [Moorena sp. SIO3G5]